MPNHMTNPSMNCNSKSKENCKLDNNYIRNNVVYQYIVTTLGKDGVHIGLTKNEIKKKRISNLIYTFKYRNRANSTGLNKCIWYLKDNNILLNIK